MIAFTRCLWLAVTIGFFIGCTAETGHAPMAAVEEATPASFNSAAAPTVEFSVPDMMCPEGCGAKTKEILAGQPGAKDVLIDFESKRAVVAVEPAEFDADAALAALIDHGFDHTTVMAPASEEPGAEFEAAIQ